MSENITKHYQETVLCWDLRNIYFQVLWTLDEDLAPGGLPCALSREDMAPSSWAGFPCCPLPDHSVVTPMKGCLPPAEEARGRWSLLAVLGQPCLACTCLTTPPLSPPAPPLHFHPFFLSQGRPCPLECAGCSLPSSPLASPHLSHHLSQPLQPEPSSLTSHRCLSLKTIFSNDPQGNSFLRHLDSETPRVIPPLLLPLSAPVPQNSLLPNRIVPETQNLVI